jgi:hypothetical protein
VQLGVV